MQVFFSQGSSLSGFVEIQEYNAEYGTTKFHKHVHDSEVLVRDGVKIKSIPSLNYHRMKQETERSTPNRANRAIHRYIEGCKSLLIVPKQSFTEKLIEKVLNLNKDSLPLNTTAT